MDENELKPRNELQRREPYMTHAKEVLGNTEHPLLAIVRECLSNVADRRPTAVTILETVKGLQEQADDDLAERDKLQLVIELQRLTTECEELQRILYEEDELGILLAEKERQIGTQREELRRLSQSLTARDREIHSLLSTISHRERENAFLEEHLQRLQSKDTELAFVQQELGVNREKLRCSEDQVTELKMILKEQTVMGMKATTQEDISIMETRLKNLALEMEHKDEEIERKTQENHELEHIINEASKEVEQLAMKKDKELDIVRIALEEKERAIQHNVTFFNDLQEEIREKEQLINKLQQRLTEQRNLPIMHQTPTSTVCNDLQERLREKDQQINKLQQRLTEQRKMPIVNQTPQPKKSSMNRESRTLSKLAQLDDGVNEKEAIEHLCAIGSKWRQLGTQFGFQENELDEIQMDSSSVNATYHCLQKLLHKKIQGSVNFGWRDIVNALRAIRENKLADRISHWYNVETHSENPMEVVKLRLNNTSEYHLKVKFSSLVNFSIEVMEKKGEKCFMDFRSSVIAIFKLKPSIRQATTYREVFDQVSQEKEWDFMVYEPLVELLKPHIEEVSSDIYTDYQQAVSAYYATKKISKTVSTMNLPKSSQGGEQTAPTIHEMQMKLFPHKVTRSSRSYIYSVWDSMSELFCLPSMKAVIDEMPSTDTEVDCLTATLPPQASQLLFERGKNSTWKAFMTENKISKITLDYGVEFSVFS